MTDVIFLEFIVGFAVFSVLLLVTGGVMIVQDKHLCKLGPKHRKRTFRCKERSKLEDLALERLHAMRNSGNGNYHAVNTVAWFVLGCQYKRF
jgi:hypothetical protein